MRSYSEAMGSLTFRISSPVCQTASASGRIWAPVGDRGADTGGRLHVDLVAVCRELVHPGRGDGYAVLVVLDFLRYADPHRALTFPSGDASLRDRARV
jgi:hypothetical protein